MIAPVTHEELPLLPHQVEEFRCSGSVLCPAFLSPDDAHALLQASIDIQQWPPPSEDDGSGLLMYTQHFERSSASASGRVLCRCENVFRRLPVLAQVADGRIARAVSQLMGEAAVLFKDKINYKNCNGGVGYAPHCDGPSAAALGLARSFVTVMIPLHAQTMDNGCLQVVRGHFPPGSVPLVQPKVGGDPDASGRVGAIPEEEAKKMTFCPVECSPGDLLFFHGWVPHRSSANMSSSPRTAAFLIYNPASEGEWYNEYFDRLARARMQFRRDALAAAEALATVPGMGERSTSATDTVSEQQCLQRAERIAAWKKKKEEEAAAAAAAALLEQEVVDEETAQLADLLAGFA